jgi:hypothetical protein
VTRQKVLLGHGIPKYLAAFASTYYRLRHPSSPARRSMLVLGTRPTYANFQHGENSQSPRATAWRKRTHFSVSAHGPRQSAALISQNAKSKPIPGMRFKRRSKQWVESRRKPPAAYRDSILAFAQSTRKNEGTNPFPGPRRQARVQRPFTKIQSKPNFHYPGQGSRRAGASNRPTRLILAARFPARPKNVVS